MKRAVDLARKMQWNTLTFITDSSAVFWAAKKGHSKNWILNVLETEEQLPRSTHKPG